MLYKKLKKYSSSNSQAVNVPKLRFPGFTEEWKKEQLRDFTERVTRKNKENETELPLTISSKDGLVDQITYFNKQVSSKDMSGYYLLKNGEFAYNKSYSVGFDFGSIKRLDRYPMGALSTLYICFALTNHNSDFIKTYFDSLKWYKEIYLIAAEGARNHGLLNVPIEDFFNTTHFIPQSEKEQKKIAEFLVLLDERIKKQEQLVESLKLYKRGAIKHILSKITNCIKLKNIVKYHSSAHTQNNLQSHEIGKYPVYDATGIFAHINTFDIDSDYIAIIKDGSGVGRVQYCVKKSTIIGTLGALIPIKCSAHFLIAVLETIDFTPFVIGAAIPHVYFKDYGNLLIPFPDEKTQSKISNIYSLMAKQIQENEKVLNELTNCKKALLQQMFI